MHITLKIVILLAGIWAALRPAVYGALSIFFVDSSAMIDLLVLGSCIIIVWDAFRSLSPVVWISSFAVLLIATNTGFFHHFRDSGESGPLPYEWLNGYYQYTLPLISLAILNRIVRRRFAGSKGDGSGNAEQS